MKLSGEVEGRGRGRGILDEDFFGDTGEVRLGIGDKIEETGDSGDLGGGDDGDGDGTRIGPAAVGMSTVPLRWRFSGILLVT